MKPIVIESGSMVSVDWTDYNLSIDDAARYLKEGRNVVAREYYDYSEDDDFYDPAVVELEAINYQEKTIDQIIHDLREYERFGSCPQSQWGF